MAKGTMTRMRRGVVVMEEGCGDVEFMGFKCEIGDLLAAVW
jgi:hypothetical protein